MTSTSQPIALVTGGGRGLGLALARALLPNGWRVVTDARRAGHLAAALPGAVVVPGDVTDPAHREALAAVVRGLARLAAPPRPARQQRERPRAVAAAPAGRRAARGGRGVFETNVLAPLALTQRSSRCFAPPAASS